MTYGHPRPTNGTNSDYPTREGNLIDALDRRLKGNLLINGAMQVWQRGTSVAVTAARTYTADRWVHYRSGFATGTTVSRQTGDNAQYCARVQRDAANADVSTVSFGQQIESVDCVPLQGKIVKLAFRARMGALFSAASAILSANIKTGTGTDEASDFSYTGLVTTGETKTLTTSWQDFEMAALTLPSNVSEIAVVFSFTPVGTAGATDYVEIEEVQLVPGEYVGTYYPYRTLAAEIADCRRFARVEAFRIPAATAVSERINMRIVPTITGGGAGYTSTGTTADAIVHFQTTGAVATLTLNAEI